MLPLEVVPSVIVSCFALGSQLKVDEVKVAVPAETKSPITKVARWNVHDPEVTDRVSEPPLSAMLTVPFERVCVPESLHEEQKLAALSCSEYVVASVSPVSAFLAVPPFAS